MDFGCSVQTRQVHSAQSNKQFKEITARM